MPTRLDFDEIRALAGAVYAEVKDEPEEVQRKRMCDWFEEMLIDAYIAGLESTGLPIDPAFDPETANRILHKEIDGETYVDRLITHIENGDAGRIENLAESESHRVSEAGAYETAKQAQEQFNQQAREEILARSGNAPYTPQNESQRASRRASQGTYRGTSSGMRGVQPIPGARVVEKVWATMEDERVRETHNFLDGVSVPLGTLFVAIDGDSARYPGDFTKAENNCSCRCWLEYRVR